MEILNNLIKAASNRLHQGIGAYADWVLRRRLWVIFTVLALVAWAGSGMRFLEFTSDYRMFFSEGNEQLLAFDKRN